MKIALVSDTHVPASLPRLPDRLLKELRGVDAILHAGDLVTLDVLEVLGAIAPTTAVVGNMDPPEVTRRLNAQEILKLGGRTIGLKHGHQPRRLQSRYIGLAYDAPCSSTPGQWPRRTADRASPSSNSGRTWSLASSS